VASQGKKFGQNNKQSHAETTAKPIAPPVNSPQVSLFCKNKICVSEDKRRMPIPPEVAAAYPS